MARPIATRWRWPPESSRGLRCEQRPELEDLRGALHLRLDLGLRDSLRIFSPYAMLSNTLMCG